MSWCYIFIVYFPETILYVSVIASYLLCNVTWSAYRRSAVTEISKLIPPNIALNSKDNQSTSQSRSCRSKNVTIVKSIVKATCPTISNDPAVVVGYSLVSSGAGEGPCDARPVTVSYRTVRRKRLLIPEGWIANSVACKIHQKSTIYILLTDRATVTKIQLLQKQSPFFHEVTNEHVHTSSLIRNSYACAPHWSTAGVDCRFVIGQSCDAA